MVLRMGWVVEQDKGFVTNYLLSKHHPTTYRHRLSKIQHISHTCIHTPPGQQAHIGGQLVGGGEGHGGVHFSVFGCVGKER